MSRLEVWTAEGLQVLEGDAATAHAMLQLVVMMKAARVDAPVAADHLATAAGRLAEPHRGNVLAAVRSLDRFDPAAPEWTDAEIPIRDRLHGERAAAERLTRNLTDDEREVDHLRGFVRDMRGHAEGLAGTDSGRELARSVEYLIEDCASIDLPGVPALVAEARALVERMRGDE